MSYKEEIQKDADMLNELDELQRSIKEIDITLDKLEKEYEDRIRSTREKW